MRPILAGAAGTALASWAIVMLSGKLLRAIWRRTPGRPTTPHGCGDLECSPSFRPG
jgi:hypothetical protein